MPLVINPVLDLHIALHQPEIAPNTGNIIRLCANTGAKLHLIKPLGFDLDDKRMRRAGLDYHEYANMAVHDGFGVFLHDAQPKRLLTLTTKATHTIADVAFQPGDVLLFGAEGTGLPADIIESVPPEQRVRLPMLPERRSYNLANAVAMSLFEAWRQQGFDGSV